jgi:uncharacterized membrane protein
MEGIQILVAILRIVAIVYCAGKASALNRSSWGWGIFGLFFPILAMIVIQFVKPIMVWEDGTRNE